MPEERDERHDLLQMALGLTPPWRVVENTFDPAAHRIDIHLDFAPGSRFACPNCGAADCPVHDTAVSTWRHLNFFQHQAYLHARVPRARCASCGVRKIAVAWARQDSGFTLLFEALLMTMLTAMPVSAVARLVGEHDTRLWRVIHHYVAQARQGMDASSVTRVAIDETAAARGHTDITLCVDIDQARVLFATEGKDAGTLDAFAEDLRTHNASPDQIEDVCIDMSPAFIKGVAESLPRPASPSTGSCHKDRRHAKAPCWPPCHTAPSRPHGPIRSSSASQISTARKARNRPPTTSSNDI